MTDLPDPAEVAEMTGREPCANCGWALHAHPGPWCNNNFEFEADNDAS